MFIKKEYNFNDLKHNAWSGAIDTINTIEEHNKEDALMDLLEELFSDSIPDETQINDFLRFETDFIFETLGIKEEED
jgi:phenylalanine-4-hydroxylase